MRARIGFDVFVHFDRLREMWYTLGARTPDSVVSTSGMASGVLGTKREHIVQQEASRCKHRRGFSFLDS